VRIRFENIRYILRIYSGSYLPPPLPGQYKSFSHHSLALSLYYYFYSSSSSSSSLKKREEHRVTLCMARTISHLSPRRLVFDSISSHVKVLLDRGHSGRSAEGCGFPLPLPFLHYYSTDPNSVQYCASQLVVYGSENRL
jgi:hypothetical protein